MKEVYGRVKQEVIGSVIRCFGNDFNQYWCLSLTINM